MYTQGTAPQKLNAVSTEKLAPLGARLIDENGRVFRYTKNGSVALGAGVLCQASAALTTSHVLGKTYSAQSAGAGVAKGESVAKLVVTTSDFAANYFAGGIFGIKASAGGAFAGTVSGHPAMTATVAQFVRLADPFPGPSAITPGTVRCGIYTNPFDGVVVCATDYARPPVCVPQLDVAADAYFWGLVEGHGLGVYEGALIEGMEVYPSLVTAGSVSTIADDLTTLTSGGRAALNGVGRCLAYVSGWSSAKGCFINWRI